VLVFVFMSFFGKMLLLDNNSQNVLFRWCEENKISSPSCVFSWLEPNYYS